MQKIKKFLFLEYLVTFKKDKYKLKNTFIVPGEPENFFLNLNLDKNELDGFLMQIKKYKLIIMSTILMTYRFLIGVTI